MCRGADVDRRHSHLSRGGRRGHHSVAVSGRGRGNGSADRRGVLTMPAERFATVSDAAVVLSPAFEPTGVLADYWALTKADINFLVAVTTWAGFYLGPPTASPEGSWTTAVHTLVATILAASGAAVLNQWMEYP